MNFRKIDQRHQVVLICFSLITLIWIIYLGVLQLKDPFNFKEITKSRYDYPKEIIVPIRGKIFDRNGELLVYSNKKVQIDVDCKSINSLYEKSFKEKYKKLAEVIGKNSSLNSRVLLNLFLRKKDKSIYVGIVDQAEYFTMKDALAGTNISRFLFGTTLKITRKYSDRYFSNRLLGFVQTQRERDEYLAKKKGELESFYDKNYTIPKTIGVNGIECSFNKYLQGEFGWREFVKSPSGNKQSTAYAHLEKKEVKHGNDVYLSIDSKVQRIIERVLKKDLEEYGAEKAICVIMNVENGDIVGMSSFSNSDLDKVPGRIRVLGNLAVSYNFEPGSTIKPFTALAAVQRKVINPEKKIDCRSLSIRGRKINDEHEFKSLDLKEIIAKSSNVGISKVAMKVGKEHLFETLLDFGFGKNTGSGIYGESSGKLASLDSWSSFSLASVSFGQEFTTTALQLTNAYATLANKGHVLKPNIYTKIQDGKKIIREESRRFRKKVSNEKSIDVVNSYLYEVVQDGTGKAAKMENFSICGKTGTAQRAKENGRGYSKNKYNSVFSGFFPYKNPKYAFTVMYSGNKMAYHFASTSAVPSLKEIVEEMMFNTDSDLLSNSDNENFVKVKSLQGSTLKEAVEYLKKNKIKYEHYSKDLDKVIIDQIPPSNVMLKKNQKLRLFVEDDNRKFNEITKMIMPDLSGMTLRQALKIAKRKKIKFQIKGGGVIYYQSIKPGETIKIGQKCILKARYEN